MNISIGKSTTDFVRIEINNQPLDNGNLLDVAIAYRAGTDFITIAASTGAVYKVTAIELEEILRTRRAGAADAPRS